MRIPLFLACSLLVASSAFSQTDNFDDGDAAGWSEVDPLGGLGAGPIAGFEVVDGAYHITSQASPNPVAAGPGRAGAFRQDVIYTSDFYLSVDIPTHDDSIAQIIGLIALVQPNPALGSTTGYGFTYQPAAQDIQITRIINEAEENTLESTIRLDTPPTGPLRLVFRGKGGVMEGRLYELDDLVNPVAISTATDTMFTSGTCGVLVSSSQADGAGTADATFDNYVANDGSLPALEIVPDGVANPGVGDEYFVRYPDWALIGFQLERSTTLRAESWEAVPAGEIFIEGGFFNVFGEFETGLSPKFRLRGP